MRNILLIHILLIGISLNCFADIKIREGSLQKPKNFPLIVKIEIGSSICTGTRISANYVLTAAHCFRKKFKSFRVIYTVNGKKKSKRISKNKVIIKSTELSHELAIIPLSDSLGNSKSYPIASYYNENYTSLDSFTILGYGLNQSGKLGKLRMGKMSFLKIYQPDNYPFPMLFLKSDNQNNIACPGDSGGPLLQKDLEGNFTLVGIVSFISSSNGGMIRLTQKKQCQKADRAAYIPLGLHSNFLSPYL